ncbi:MAG: tetratricopeptide repeat protein [Bacteroidota bacterium]
MLIKKNFHFFLVTFLFSVAIEFSFGQSEEVSVKDTTVKNTLLDEAAYYTNRDPSLSIKYAKQALSQSSEGEFNRLKAYYYLGYAHYRDNNYDSAVYFLNHAISENKEIDDKGWQALIINRLGNTYQLKGDYESALKQYQKALELNEQADEQGEIARSLTNIGSIYRTFGNYDEAIKFHLRALEIYEELEATEGIAWTSLNIARLFKLNGNYNKALDYLDKSYEIYKTIAEQQEVQTGETLCLKEYGLIYSKAGETDKALEYSMTVLKRNKENDNQYGVASSLINIGKIYYDKEEYDTSLNYLNKALSLKRSLEDKVELSSLLRLIGENYMRKDSLQVALNYYLQSLEEAEQQNLKGELKDIYSALSRLYRQTKDYEKALEYYELHSALKDSLADQHTTELEMQYEFEKEHEKFRFEQERQQALQEAKLKRQRIIKWAFIVGFALVSLLLFVIYRSYKRKIETNKQLELQKEEIETQRDEIEAQRDLATKQRDQISKQNQIITESIEYAGRIQNAVLPQEENIKNFLYDYFVLYKPKNIVSGDFYWMSKVDGKIIVAAADCTGHGVPGAFMSMLGVAFLNDIVNQSKVISPNEILNQLRKDVIGALHQSVKNRSSRDGMDISLSVIDPEEDMLYFSGAYNPVYIIREGQLHEVKADRMPIGIHASYQDNPFSIKTFKLTEGDHIYMFSDGFYDQFGGERGLKFGRKSFKNMLIDNSDKTMSEQHKELQKTLSEWQKNWPQIDDIMVLGIHYA